MLVIAISPPNIDADQLNLDQMQSIGILCTYNKDTRFALKCLIGGI